MKKILASLLVCFALCATAKDKPDPAFAKGDITLAAAYGIPHFWQTPVAYNDAFFRSVHRGSAIAVAQYQLSRAFHTGITYQYFTLGTGMLAVKNRYTNTPYQREGWGKANTVMATADYCYVNRGRVSVSSGLALGVSIENSSYHVIDSVGISTHGTSNSHTLFILDLRLVDAKVRLTENLGLYFSSGVRSLVGIGAHYTFNKHKN